MSKYRKINSGKDIADILALNNSWVEAVTGEMQKYAQEQTTDFIRSEVRERGLYRRIIPMKQATNDMLTPQVDTQLPCIVEEMQPDSPAAVSIPFRTLPPRWYVRGRKFRVTFSRIASERFQVDADELRTWRMDIREVLSEQAVKDITAEEDRSFFAAVNSALVGAGSTVPATGTVQWETIVGGITRDTVLEARSIMSKTPNALIPTTAVINSVTANQVLKLNAVETGDEITTQMLREGISALDGLFGLNWLVTIKRYLVPDDTIYFFADPDYIGRSYVLTDVTMVTKVEGPDIEWWYYETIGGAIANVAGLARADFT